MHSESADLRKVCKINKNKCIFYAMLNGFAPKLNEFSPCLCYTLSTSSVRIASKNKTSFAEFIIMNLLHSF